MTVAATVDIVPTLTAPGSAPSCGLALHRPASPTTLAVVERRGEIMAGKFIRAAVGGLLVLSGLATAALADTVLRADGYLDVAAGRIISPAVIVVADGHIRAVNPPGVPDGVPTIDLPGQVLLPGLIDVHTHLTMEISGDWVTRPVRETMADAALRGAAHARRTLLAGFTTVRDLGGVGGADVALMRAIGRGDVIGPRMIPARNSLSITGGHCDTTGFAPGVLEGGADQGLADGIDEVLKAVRYQIKHGAKVIKICATAGVLSFEGPAGAQQYPEATLRAAAEEAHRHGLKIAAHAHGTEGIKAAIRAGIDSIEHSSLIDAEGLKLAKEQGTYLVFNIYPPGVVDIDALPAPLQAKARYVFPRREKNFTKAVKAGVKLPFGTDAGVYRHGLNAQQFAVKLRLGQKPADAIRSATTVAAELIDRPDRGRLAPGLLADIVAVAGNPLDNIRLLENVTFVMKGGTVYKRP